MSCFEIRPSKSRSNDLNASIEFNLEFLAHFLILAIILCYHSKLSSTLSPYFGI